MARFAALTMHVSGLPGRDPLDAPCQGHIRDGDRQPDLLRATAERVDIRMAAARASSNEMEQMPKLGIVRANSLSRLGLKNDKIDALRNV
jgi:hypothetical protein